MVLSKGDKSDAVRSLQEMLNYLHYQGRTNDNSGMVDRLSVDGMFGEDTEDAVLAFQEEYGLYRDGKAGPITLSAIEKTFSTRQIEISAPIPGSANKPLTIEIGRADAYKDGYGRVRLRSDVLVAYNIVYDEVHRLGGILTSSGGIRDLNAHVGPNRSATSFHYSGRALDLHVGSGMQKPQTDPYVVQRLGNRQYKVYARCSAELAASEAIPKKITIEDVVTYSQRAKGTKITGHFFDLTKLFADNGFKPIRARPAFESKPESSFLGAEWWHFQWESGLIEGVTTFGNELQKIYPKSKLVGSPPWKFRNYIWKNEWF